MNLLFGSTAADGGGTARALAAAVAEVFGAEATVLAASGDAPAPALGAFTDGGAIVGWAAGEAVTLAYIGVVTQPLPDWTGAGSPVDDPHATARFLLHRYLAQGRGFLAGVTGQYALAVMDNRSGTTLLAADPAGGRSWFICDDHGGLNFSSHLLTLARSRGRALAIDRSLEDFLLIHGFYPFGRTPYAGITALPPGSLLEWRAGRTTVEPIPATDPWPEVTAAGTSPRSESAIVDALHAAMLRAVREQLPSRPQRVAVLLGGFDSALVAALVHKLGFEVETYSFHYEDAGYNQPHTGTLARHLGIRHVDVPIDRGMIEDGLRRFPQAFNQPTNWPNYVIQTAALCERIRASGIRHCYSGDGCDAVFLGYPGTYLRARVFAALPRPPRWLFRSLIALAARPLPERLLGHPYRVALGMLRGLGRSQAARGYLSFRILDEVSLRQLRRGPEPAGARNVDQLADELAAPFAALPTLRLAYQGKAAVSPNRNKLIGSSDLSGVTILAPYMHAGLKQFALSLPEELLRPSDSRRASATGKYILMKMAEQKGLLPAAIIHQPKVAAVDGPIDAWYAGPSRPLLMEMMRGLPFDYDSAYLQRLLDLKASEALFKRSVMTDKVISHAVSLLATYAAFTGVARR